MKRGIAFWRVLLALGVFPCSLDAQALIQRMAISAGRYVVPPGTSRRIASICLDETREAPAKGDIFRYSYGAPSSSRVHVGQQARALSLADIIAQGFAQAVVGSDGEMEFRNLGKQPLTFDFDKGQILSRDDEPPDNGRLSVASGFRAPPPPTSKTPHSILDSFDDSKGQMAAWKRVRNTELQILLRDLGNYTRPVDGVWGPRTRDALDDFLSKSGEGDIRSTDFLEDQPSDAAMEAVKAAAVQRYEEISEEGRRVVAPDLSQRLGELGFVGSGLADRIRSLQKFHGRTPDGKPFPEIVPILKSDEEVRTRLETVLGRNESEITGERSAVQDLFRNFQASHQIPADGIVSAPALAMLDNDTTLAKQLSELGFYVSSKGLKASIGEYNSSRSLPAGTVPDSVAFRAAVDHDRDLAIAVSAAVDPVRTKESRADRRIVGVSPEGTVLVHDGNKNELWSGFRGRAARRIPANDPIRSFESAFATDASDFSSTANQFVYVPSWKASTSSQVNLTFGDQRISISAASLREFIENGQAIPQLDAAVSAIKANQSRPRLILLRDPIIAYASMGAIDSAAAQLEFSDVLETGRVHMNPEALARALATRYADRIEVLLANDTDLAYRNVQRLPTTSRAEDVTIYSRTRITDYDLIAKRSAQLERSGIRVYYGSEKSSSANIVLITGSRDAGLQQELDQMLNDGLLEGKLLVLLSCYSGTCEISHSLLLRHARGPSGVLFYPTRIRPDAVDAVLSRLSTILNRENAPERISRYLSRAVDEAAAAETDPELRREILKLRDALLQVSRVLAPPSKAPFDGSGIAGE